MPEVYGAYAPIYRVIGQDAWSQEMARWSLRWLAQHGAAAHTVVDWGCGDGAAALVFASAGCATLGVDCSAAMLELAASRARAAGFSVEWHRGDLRSARLGQQASLATAFYDTLNYLTSSEDLCLAWQTLAASITNGGYVIADLNTPYEYATGWRGQWIVTADTDDMLVLNRLRYNARSGIARGRIVWFERVGAANDWRRGSEIHLQRAHTDDEIVAAIEGAGLHLIERYTPHEAPVSATATRIIYVAGKP